MPAALPSAVIFDWDNTLIDSWQAIAGSVNHALAYAGLPLWSMDQVKKNCVRSAREIFPEIFGQNWQAIYKIYYSFYETNALELLKPLHGALETLEWLRTRNVPLFVVSNKKGTYLRREVSQMGWSNRFSAVVGAEDTLHDKPARDPVDLALSMARIIPNKSVWFIGDSVTDIQCALNSGCTPIGFGNTPFGDSFQNLSKVSDHNALIRLLFEIENHRFQ